MQNQIRKLTLITSIFPAMVHFTVAKSTLAKVGDILLGIFGLVITIYCTYLGAAEWAKKGSHEH